VCREVVVARQCSRKVSSRERRDLGEGARQEEKGTETALCRCEMPAPTVVSQIIRYAARVWKAVRRGMAGACANRPRKRRRVRRYGVTS